MAEQLDPKVAAVLDSHLEKPTGSGKDEAGEEDLFAELEEDESAVEAFREQRLQQLHEELMRAKKMKDQGFGYYAEVISEKEVLDITTSTKYSIVHFFHSDFRRCRIIDTHLENLAQKHFDTKLIRINVGNAPFLVEKLNVRVLPCVISFVDGKSVGRLEGFEKLGNTDDFTTATLEGHFLDCGVIQRAKATGKEGHSKAIFKAEPKSEDGDDGDWD